MRRATTVALMVIGLLIPATAALADPISLGPCNDPNAVVVRVGQTAKVCVNP